MTLIIGLVTIALAIALGVYAVWAPSTAQAAPFSNEKSGSLALTGRSRGAVKGVSDDPDDLPPLYDRFRAITLKLSPADYAHRLQHRLDLAGNPRGYRADRVMAFKGVGLLFGVLLGGYLGAHRGVSAVLWAAIGGALFFFLPDILIRNLGEKRQIEIQKGLPDALDMMTVCVEAGLGFDAALMRVALNVEGPVAQEWARVLQEMQFGKSRTDALRGLIDRTDVTELRTFVSSLVQSSELGISVGAVLREQAHDMRIRRRQRAEEQAQKLPVKILLPLISCLLPAMFIVVLGPAAIKIFDTLGNLNH